MPKLTPEELLRSFDDVHEDGSGDEETDEDMEAVLAMTPEQIQKELEAAGYTEAELVAKEDALLGRHAMTPAADGRASTTASAHAKATAEATAKSAAVIPLRARRRVSRWVILLPIAAAFALVALEGPATIAWWNDEPDASEPVTHPNNEPDDAPSMRREATRAMEAGEWRKALELLDRAKKEDPAGDEAPEVQDARRVAREGLVGLGGVEGGGER